jgi:hypothetical protein
MVTTTDGMSSVFSDGWAGFCGVAALMILLGTGKDTIRLSTTIADIARAERQGMAFLERSTPIVSICLSAAGTSQVIRCTIRNPSPQSPNRELVPYL